MHQRLTAGGRNQRRSAFIHRFETVFRGEIGFQDVGGVLDLAASSASQVAAEQRLEHEHERIALASGQFLAQDVRSHCPHLGYGNCHCSSRKNVSLFYRILVATAAGLDTLLVTLGYGPPSEPCRNGDLLSRRGCGKGLDGPCRACQGSAGEKQALCFAQDHTPKLRLQISYDDKFEGSDRLKECEHPLIRTTKERE